MRLGVSAGRIGLIGAVLALAGLQQSFPRAVPAQAQAPTQAPGQPSAQAGGKPGACSRDDFATVVEQAGDALRAMNAENTPKFQTKLRALKERHKWTHDQFMKEAAPYVQDDKILGLDEQTATLLNKIQGLGEGGSGREPDCGLLEILRTHMRALIETTESKWSYMNSKIDRALAAAQ